MAAFAFVFIEWRGKTVVLSIIIATYILPFETVAVPLLLLVNNLPWLTVEGVTWGWLNSYQVQIIPWIVRALEIFLFVQYFRDLPKELVEASRVDGASWFQIYRRVVMPLSGPVIATVAILKFLEMQQPVHLADHGGAGRGLPPDHGWASVFFPTEHCLG